MIRSKIVIVLPSLKPGGLERVGTLLANAFAVRFNTDLYLIVLDRTEIFYPIDARVTLIQPHFQEPNKAKRIFKTFFWLKKELKKIKPHRILSLGEGYNSFVIAANLFKKYPIFVSNRASPLSSLTGMRGFLNPFFYKYAEGVIVQTNKAREILKSKYKNCRFIVIPNPLPQFENPVGQDNRDLQIINVGSIGGKKNQDFLLHYFKELNVTFPQWTVAFIGDGPRLPNLKEQIIRYNLEEKIFLKGRIKNVEAYYQKASVFAFTSTSEGFPNVLGEAMAAGMAVISFDCIAGPADLIDDGLNGFLVPVNDHKQYVDKLGRLMDDVELRRKFGANAKEKMKKFNEGMITEVFFRNITGPTSASSADAGIYIENKV